MNKSKKEKGRYPYGIYSKSDIIVGIILFVLNLAISLFIAYILIFMARLNVYLVVFIFFISFVILNIIIGFIFYLIFNTYKRIQRSFYKTADFDLYFRRIDKLLVSNKLHTDSVLKLLLTKLKAMILLDYMEANKVIQKLEIEKESRHRLSYLELNVLINLENNNYVKANDYIKLIRKEYKVEDELIKELELKYNMLSTKNNIDNILDLVKVDTNNKYDNLYNIHYLYLYYLKRNNKEKTEYYYNLLTENISKYQKLLNKDV